MKECSLLLIIQKMSAARIYGNLSVGGEHFLYPYYRFLLRAFSLFRRMLLLFLRLRPCKYALSLQNLGLQNSRKTNFKSRGRKYGQNESENTCRHCEYFRFFCCFHTRNVDFFLFSSLFLKIPSPFSPFFRPFPPIFLPFFAPQVSTFAPQTPTFFQQRTTFFQQLPSL